METYLKIYNRNDEVIAVSYNVKDGIGKALMENLQSHTLYKAGEFKVAWVKDGVESEKIVVPEFATLERTTKEFVFYFNEYLSVTGKSVYDIAKEHGFSGTEKDFLDSLHGRDGLNSYELWLSQGGKGDLKDYIEAQKIKGDTGDSAYEIWKKNGNTGTEKDFLNSLKSTQKSTITVSNGMFYVDGVSTGAIADGTQAIEYNKAYVASRGQNLVTNGNGYLGDNTNFQGKSGGVPFKYKVSNSDTSFSYFYSDASVAQIISDEVIPVDTTKTYSLEHWVKSDNNVGVQYAGVQCLDMDGNIIVNDHVVVDDFEPVQLTKPLKKGDKKIYVNDLSPWLDSRSPWSSIKNDSRGVLVWGWESKKGYKYPTGEYSRYSQKGIDSIDEVEKSITLTTAWIHENNSAVDKIFPVGHEISRVRTGTSFNYLAIGGQKAPKTWTKYSGTISGVARIDNNKFKPATVAVKLVFLVNYNYADTVYYKNIEFKEIDPVTYAPLAHDHDSRYLKLEDGQNYKLTNNDGSAVVVNGVDFNAIDTFLSKTGYYFSNSTINYPSGENPHGYITFIRSTSLNAKLIYQGYANNNMYIKTKSNGTWGPWVKINGTDSHLTGTWTSAVLQNGFTGSVKYMKDSNGLVTVIFDVTVGATVNGAIASIPTSHCPSFQQPIPTYNASTSLSDISTIIYPGALATSKALTTGQNYKGQVTFRKDS